MDDDRESMRQEIDKKINGKCTTKYPLAAGLVDAEAYYYARSAGVASQRMAEAADFGSEVEKAL